MKRKQNSRLPEVAELERELEREQYKVRYRQTLKSTIYALITVAAAAVLVATLWLPVLKIYGNSMTPTLNNGQIVLSWKTRELETEDIIAFYYNNKVLVKRVIATPGEYVTISEDGTVFINGAQIDEPYLSEKSLGECDLEFPYQVPEERYFLMGDHRQSSVDSRSSVVGCIAKEQIVGKILFSVWPFDTIGAID